MEPGRKGREVIRLGPVPQRGDSEEKGEYMGRDQPWGVSSLNHILRAPVLGLDTGETSPFGWLDGR